MADETPYDFVTEPPRKKGVTGKISTLFRRDDRKKKDSTAAAETPRASGASNAPRGGQPTFVPPQNTQRIFYSENEDDEDNTNSQGGEEDDTQDSYDDRLSVDDDTTNGNTLTTGTGTSGAGGRIIQRYRGFSTSIKSLFLDESLVCASMGCFGLFLSNRTEYLLQLRNERRGTLSPHATDGKKLPSRIVTLLLALTLALLVGTFLVFGFGSGNGLTDAYAAAQGGSYEEQYYEQQQNNQDNQYQSEYGNGEEYVEWDDWLQNNGGNYGQNKYSSNNNNGYSNNKYSSGNSYNNNYSSGNSYNNNYSSGNSYSSSSSSSSGSSSSSSSSSNTGYYSSYGSGYGSYTGGGGYSNYGGGNRRAMEVSHRPTGVFKIRDLHQNVWQPIVAFVKDEWERTDDIQENRRMEDYQNAQDNYNAQNYNQNQYSQNQDSEEMDRARQLRKDRRLATMIRLGIVVAFLLFLWIIGRRRRMRTRFYLVRARAQEDHLYFASTEAGEGKNVNLQDSREDQYEGACSHTPLGCYPVDEVTPEEVDNTVEVTDTGIFKAKKQPYNEDVMARCFNLFMSCCCGFACKCWLQCMSVCALAQEAREIRLLVPLRYQRIDFITHQPFREYYKNILDLRRRWMGIGDGSAGVRAHWDALSTLSKWILGVSLVLVLAIVTTLILNPRAAFSWQDGVVLGATFLQSFLVLFCVHWIFHRSDLSLDAVVKLFTSGFVIAMPSAMFFQAVLVNIVIVLAFAVYESINFFFVGFEDVTFEHWRAIWIFGELFNAYVVAAVTEEVCKYYSFRAVEHPDLLFLTGLNRFEKDEDAIEGGVVSYPFGSHKVQELNRNNSFDSHRSNISKATRRSQRAKATTKEELLDTDDAEDELDIRTYRQRAMAITTGMISVAVGLACAENFVYIFLLGGAVSHRDPDDEDIHASDLMEEWIVLFFRSIFPVHALAAAMSSINVIRKYVEGSNDDGHRIGVGRILLPAIILHGTFDAVLMGVKVFIETAWEREAYYNNGVVNFDDPPYNTFAINLVAWIGISLIMFAGFLWYVTEYRKQRQRLIVLEGQDKSNWQPAAAKNEIV